MSMISSVKPIYTSKIIKAGALLADTKTMLANWDESQSSTENLKRFKSENIFGKASRSRIEDILAIFRQRYLTDENTAKSLATLIHHNFPPEALDRILYFHATQSDSLLHDFVTDYLTTKQRLGIRDIYIEDVERWISENIAEGKTSKPWSNITIKRSAQELLSTLRDFAILKGGNRKELAPIYLPVEAFAYIAFFLKEKGAQGQSLITEQTWQLFFLPRELVERLFLEAHQQNLLEFFAAGSTVRITFPAESIEEYANVIAQRPY